MLGPDDLVLCAGTIAKADLSQRIRTASDAGFAAISLYLEDYGHARDAGWTDADLRSLLDDHGLVIAELDPLLSWLPVELPKGAGRDSRTRAMFGHGEEAFYAVADSLGARSINLAAFTQAQLEIAQIAECFGGVCDRAAEHGLLAHLEFLPWTQIPDVRTALEIVELADRPNGGIMVDSWHHFRSGAGDDALRAAPGERILGVQLNDAPREPEGDLVTETLARRRMPGEGDIDLVGLVGILDEIGSKAPVGVEVFSDALRELPAAEVAGRAGDATRAILAQARPGPRG